MSGAREPDDRTTDEALRDALRRAETEARPRPEFQDALRAGFVGGSLRPSAAPSPRILALPRRVLYPAAAAVLALAFALSGALGRRAPVDPPIPMPEGFATPEAALRAAEGRLAAIPALAAAGPWRHRIVEGRPWLLPEAAAYADGRELRALGATMGEAERALARNLPSIAARAAAPVVTIVAPTREVFEALAGPLLAPLEVGAFTVAFAHRDAGVLLLSPEALAPGGPPCEPMYVTHEAAHAWLHARAAPGARLPLWVEEGLAGAASSAGFDARGWCAQVLGVARREALQALTPPEVLAATEFGGMARLVGSRAPRREEPYALVPLFHAEAEGLALFLTDSAAPERTGAFARWLGDRLDGRPADPEGTARDLGFADVPALFAARDAWLGP